MSGWMACVFVHFLFALVVLVFLQTVIAIESRWDWIEFGDVCCMLWVVHSTYTFKIDERDVNTFCVAGWTKLYSEIAHSCRILHFCRCL